MGSWPPVGTLRGSAHGVPSTALQEDSGNIERLFALHPRRVLRQGWRTDVVHYLVNGAALRIGLLVSVVAFGGVLRVFVPAPLRHAVAASQGWVQLVAGLAIAVTEETPGSRLSPGTGLWL